MGRASAPARALEKKETFSAARLLRRNFGNARQRAAFERGERIEKEQGFGGFLTKLIAHGSVGRAKQERTAGQIVGIAGHEMNEAFSDPGKSVLAWTFAKTSGDRAAGDLDKAPLAHPTGEPLRLRPEDGVALGMSDDGPETGEMEPMESLVHGPWNRKFVEFDEQVIPLIDAEGSGILMNGGKIFWIEMKIAAGGELEAAFEPGLEIVAQAADFGVFKFVARVGMRGGDEASDSVGDCGFRHGERLLDGGRAIVNSGQDVAVQINHGCGEASDGHRIDRRARCGGAGDPKETKLSAQEPNSGGKRARHLTIILSQ